MLNGSNICQKKNALGISGINTRILANITHTFSRSVLANRKLEVAFRI